MTPSSANFLFVKHPALSGEEVYRKMRERGILIRHFSVERIKDYNRISIGTDAQMEALVAAARDIVVSC